MISVIFVRRFECSLVTVALDSEMGYELIPIFLYRNLNSTFYVSKSFKLPKYSYSRRFKKTVLQFSLKNEIYLQSSVRTQSACISRQNWTLKIPLFLSSILARHKARKPQTLKMKSEQRRRLWNFDKSTEVPFTIR